MAPPQVACKGSWREGGQQWRVSVTQGPDCPQAELRVPSQREGAHGDDWNRSGDVGHINKVIFFSLSSPSIYIILHSAHHHYYQPQGLCHVMCWCIELWDWLEIHIYIFFHWLPLALGSMKFESNFMFFFFFNNSETGVVNFSGLGFGCNMVKLW